MIRSIMSAKEFDRVTNNSPIMLNDQSNAIFSDKVYELRLSISILFSFLRDTSPDKVVFDGLELISCD